MGEVYRARKALSVLLTVPSRRTQNRVDRQSEVRSQKSEVRSQKSEVKHLALLHENPSYFLADSGAWLMSRPLTFSALRR